MTSLRSRCAGALERGSGSACAFVAGVVIGALALMTLNAMLRSEPFLSFPTPPTQPGRPEPIEIVRLALAIVAGVAGLVALNVPYGRQGWLEQDETGWREQQKAFNDRYGAAAAQLGHDNPIVRLARVYASPTSTTNGTPNGNTAMMSYALPSRPLGPNVDNRHTLARKAIEVPGNGRPSITDSYASATGESEVRRSIVRVIADHLLSERSANDESQPGHRSDLKLDFTTAILPEGALNGCHFSSVNFSGRRFVTDAHFDAAKFAGHASFERATFARNAFFEAAHFSKGVRFDLATFSKGAFFSGARLSFTASVVSVAFSGGFWFRSVGFLAMALFEWVTFSGITKFEGASFAVSVRADASRWANVSPDVHSVRVWGAAGFERLAANARVAPL